MMMNWAIDKLIAIPPTSGIAPLCSFRSLGLSTKPTAFAAFRITKSDEKEKKPTNDSSNNMMNSSQIFNGFYLRVAYVKTINMYTWLSMICSLFWNKVYIFKCASMFIFSVNIALLCAV
ncbi:hypothetical protein VCHA57P527_90029 [Vibrio chagasii]|nr:hypothetical protein VCHA57P527_90029 [Vibrio chagasii]